MDNTNSKKSMGTVEPLLRSKEVNKKKKRGQTIHGLHTLWVIYYQVAGKCLNQFETGRAEL